jgi:hypothetical protein
MDVARHVSRDKSLGRSGTTPQVRLGNLLWLFAYIELRRPSAFASSARIAPDRVGELTEDCFDAAIEGLVDVVEATLRFELPAVE